MSFDNKKILENANAAIIIGDHEGFLRFCTDDTKWTFVGDKVLRGKDAVRDYMRVTYAEPPVFVVDNLIADDDFVTALGKISMKNEKGEVVSYAYCDFWRFREGKMAELKAFVIEIPS